MPMSPHKTHALTPFWQSPELYTLTRPSARLYLGNAVNVLRRMLARSAHTVITSPPYWNLRDYGTGTWEGGSLECDHIEPQGGPSAKQESSAGTRKIRYRRICAKCGARRTDQQLGMEEVADCLGWATGKPCGECFACHMVEVFNEVHRVLRDDGTLWLNLGDTFDDGQGMVPAAVAMALRASGWKLVQDIIWYAPNKMPESVTNRCAKSHEHIFLLAKSGDYYFDAEAIRVKAAENNKPHAYKRQRPNDPYAAQESDGRELWGREETANKRDVWIVPTKGYPGAHYACFSPKLITPCILAGTSEHGCCAECGKPYERVLFKGPSVMDDGYVRSVPPGQTTQSHQEGRVRSSGQAGGAYNPPGQSPHSNARDKDRDRSFNWSRNGIDGGLDGPRRIRETVGWRKACGCTTDKVVPCTVLDPFVGSGTTVATAIQLGRVGIGIDLSETYLRENAIPRIEAALAGERPKRKVTVAVAPAKPPGPSRLRG